MIAAGREGHAEVDLNAMNRVLIDAPNPGELRVLEAFGPTCSSLAE